MNTSKHNVDMSVVGTMTGGATVAKDLSQKKKKVLMFEWGDYAVGLINYISA